MNNIYLSTSEYVTSGHPDRLADNLAAGVINAIQEKDGVNSHAAIEVFLTHDTIIFGGEATTTLKLDNAFLRGIVEQAYNLSGYLPEMRKHWSKKEVKLAKDMKIKNCICAQSPDIALGTTDKGKDSGWNDQNVSFSSSESTRTKLGFPMEIATFVGQYLFGLSRKRNLHSGPDIKVLASVRVEADGVTPIELTALTIAVPHTSEVSVDVVRDFVCGQIKLALHAHYPKLNISSCDWVINGTGRFVVHGNISDTSMTGRKISVNHPSAGPVWMNKMIGGGSLVKPWHASDLLLNLAARQISNWIVASGLSTYAVVGISGAIGQANLQSLFIQGDPAFEKKCALKNKVYNYIVNLPWTPYQTAERLGLFKNGFNFLDVVNNNFFGHPLSQPWEDMTSKLNKAHIKALSSM